MRINAYIARHTKLSRRKADQAITEGRVFVNGLPSDVGQEIVAEDTITLDGKPILAKTLRYIVVNKPVGYVTSRRKTTEAPIVYDLLPEELHRLKPAGRLDKDSEGILLLTNDGEVIQKLTHPNYGKEKQYFVTLDVPLSKEDKKKIENGVLLKDGTSAFHIEEKQGGYLLTLKEGRNRQIRRTFGALDYRIEQLKRVAFGPYELQELQLNQGEWKEVAPPVNVK